MDAWRLAEAVNLRPEVFGGMAFHREQGITVEMDEEAYRFLCTYLEPHPLPAPGHAAARLVPQLVRLGFLRSVERNASSRDGVEVRSVRAWKPALLSGNGYTLSAPEVVHVAITARCNRSCPGCYVPCVEEEQELTVAEWRALIDQWASMRVFQLAVGGGEPLLYAGLFDVLYHARMQGIVPNLTTNGMLLDAQAVRELERAGVARVNVSWNGPIGDDGGGSQTVYRALRLLLVSTVQVGANLLVTPALPSRLPQILARLQVLGVRWVTLLRPKPPAVPTEAGRAWYEANRLRRTDLLCLRKALDAWQGALGIEVGSALVGLMGDAEPALLRRRGIYGCAAGRRMCTVWPDGRVTPCSFLADLDAGNVRQMPFDVLWARGAGWERLRDLATRPSGGCAGCATEPQCGGARCVAQYERGDPFAGDAECPYQGNGKGGLTDEWRVSGGSKDGKGTSLQVQDGLCEQPVHLFEEQRAV
jgi:radical SAM protein with 4Fe4S-binding SPASM domain